MVYSNYFVEYLDGYKEGLVKIVNLLILSIILFGVFTWMMISAIRKYKGY